MNRNASAAFAYYVEEVEVLGFPETFDPGRANQAVVGRLVPSTEMSA